MLSYNILFFLKEKTTMSLIFQHFFLYENLLDILFYMFVKRNYLKKIKHNLEFSLKCISMYFNVRYQY